ncbi:MAG: hypothetical protein M1826_000431 [Phylliscum demangeonii]|nr:MAG: hypothetical protein M1826_000431 [Phylliscum demangeonii]
MCLRVHARFLCKHTASISLCFDPPTVTIHHYTTSKAAPPPPATMHVPVPELECRACTTFIVDDYLREEAATALRARNADLASWEPIQSSALAEAWGAVWNGWVRGCRRAALEREVLVVLY